MLNEALSKAGLNLSNLTKEQQKTIIDNFDANYDDIQTLNLVDTDSLGLDISKNYLIDSINSSNASQEQKNKSINDVNTLFNENTSTEEKFNQVKSVTNNVKIDSGQVVAKAEGITDEDIVTGKAQIHIDKNGLVNWNDISGLELPKWDSRYNTVVKRVPHPTISGAFTIVDAGTNKYLDLNEDGSPTVRITIHPGNTLEDLRKKRPCFLG